ncbi:MAG: hypothetical protein H8D97_00820 [Proteobacteria bacterium]|nr:hypothetical protein [Pseudomonadota bacterium]
MMTQKHLYEFVYEKLKENLLKNELDMIHPNEDLWFSIDNQNFKLFCNTGEEETSVDLIWQIGIERKIFVNNPDLEDDNEKEFKARWMREMQETEDYMQYIGELDFFNDGLNEFLMNTF